MLMVLYKWKKYKLLAVLSEKVGIKYDIPNKDSPLIFVPVVRVLRQLMSFEVLGLQGLVNAFDCFAVDPLEFKRLKLVFELLFLQNLVK